MIEVEKVHCPRCGEDAINHFICDGCKKEVKSFSKMCSFCNAIYCSECDDAIKDFHSIWEGSDNPYWSEHKYHICPKCRKNPKIKKRMSYIRKIHKLRLLARKAGKEYADEAVLLQKKLDRLKDAND